MPAIRVFRVVASVAAFLLVSGWAAAQNTGIDPAALDRRVDPCVDFYQFSCRNWIKNNPIPSDQPAWGRFNELFERNRLTLRGILQSAADLSTRTPNEQRIGDYYAACMNEPAVNQQGLTALDPEFGLIAALRDHTRLPALLAHLHRKQIDAFFQFGSGPDVKNTKEVIAQADQGGLSLPDRDYYLKDDQKTVDQRKAYVDHVSRMFRLLGDSPDEAAAEAAVVLKIETALARASMDRVTRREPANTYHKMTTDEWQRLTPSMSWSKYLDDVGAPRLSSLNVVAPDFFRALDAELHAATLGDLKTYLRWHVVHAAASTNVAPDTLVTEHFNFFAKTLRGAMELPARWKRCVTAVDAGLGDALGQTYVERVFPLEAKERTLNMVRALEAALHQDITTLPWMSDATKKQALLKLEAIENKIGYPHKWRDYTALKIVRDEALGNVLRANAFRFERQLRRIGTPRDTQEWDVTAPTVNAYYNSAENDIVFPAGILQPPLYDFHADDAVNFGALGAVIGHELTHGFDDQGRRFDQNGALTDWWTPEDAKAFEERAQCLVDEYNGFIAVDDVHLNGKLALGENTADNGGLRIAEMALQSALVGKPRQTIDGFTEEQRFFLGWGQIWCEGQTDQLARLRALTDPHAPGEYRVNGVVRNMPEFRKAWSCSAGAPMAPVNACRVW